jgi:hypothetical protein
MPVCLSAPHPVATTFKSWRPDGLRGSSSFVSTGLAVAMMPEDEMLVRVIDHALTECFRHHKKWRRPRS